MFQKIVYLSAYVCALCSHPSFTVKAVDEYKAQSAQAGISADGNWARRQDG